MRGFGAMAAAAAMMSIAVGMEPPPRPKYRPARSFKSGRSHGINPREPVAPSILASAEKRKRLYMHAAARRRFDEAASK